MRGLPHYIGREGVVEAVHDSTLFGTWGNIPINAELDTFLIKEEVKE